MRIKIWVYQQKLERREESKNSEWIEQSKEPLEMTKLKLAGKKKKKEKSRVGLGITEGAEEAEIRFRRWWWCPFSPTIGILLSFYFISFTSSPFILYPSDSLLFTDLPSRVYRVQSQPSKKAHFQLFKSPRVNNFFLQTY